jgi:hypothetical protein
MRKIDGFSWVLIATALLAAAAVAQADAPKPAPAPAKPPAVTKPAAPAKPPTDPVCKLVDAEVPRGGRLEVTGERFGQAPVVRIAGKVARMLERRDDRISVQVAADSNGGAVTLQNGDKTADCGTLVIIGKNH